MIQRLLWLWAAHWLTADLIGPRRDEWAADGKEREKGQLAEGRTRRGKKMCHFTRIDRLRSSDSVSPGTFASASLRASGKTPPSRSPTLLPSVRARPWLIWDFFFDCRGIPREAKRREKRGKVVWGEGYEARVRDGRTKKQTKHPPQGAQPRRLDRSLGTLDWRAASPVS